MPKEYRSRTRIILDVLRAVRDEGENGVTRLLFVANLSHPRLVEYLDEVKAKGWVSEREEGGRKLYALTDEGVRMITELAKISRFMEDFGLEL